MSVGRAAAQGGMPDNVLNTDCMYFAESHAWSIVEDWHTAEEYCARIIPLVGDVNGDGVPEIIVFKSNGYYNTNEMYVVDSRTHQRVHTISLPRQIKVDHAAPYGLVKLPATAAGGLAGHVIIVIATDGNYLYAFDLTARGTSPIWSASGTGFPAPTVAFSDFNCDGHPEVYIANKIYDAETGALLVTAPGSNAGKAHGHANATNVIASFAADVTEDGKPDLILGNEVYSITLTNRSGTAGNSATLAARCTPPSGLPTDGHAQVADFNYDGHLDILITCKTASRGDASCYVWDVYNNTVSTPVVESQCYEGMAVPLIADIDNNGTVEIVWQTAYCYGGRNNNPGNNMRAYKYDPSTRSFSEMWQLRIHDDSYSVPATLFDLNNDGYNDIIITDDDGIKIVNGSGKSHLTGHDTLAVYTESSFSIRANTTMQYAVVADIDGSGSAKILVLGKSGSYNGYLYAFRSVDDPWMPARKVWNQYIYNATCVNEDLTIPQYPYNNAMALTDPVTNEVRRPYNNCLQQSTAIDIYGRKVTITADVNNATVTSAEVADSVELTITYCNNGAADLVAPYPITLRSNSLTGPVIEVIYGTSVLPRGGCTTLTKRLATSRVLSEGIAEVFVVVNATAAGIAQEVAGLQMECNITNNSASALLLPVVHATADSTVCADALPVTWNDSVFTTAGSKTTHLVAVGGEDSVLTMTVHVNPVYNTDDYDTIIENALPYLWEGYSFGAAGTHTKTLGTDAGCDSVVTMHLHVWMNKHENLDSTVCDNRYPVVWNGQTFTSASTLTATLTASHGEDSVLTMTVHENPTYTVDDYDTIVENALPYLWEGFGFGAAGSQTMTLVSGAGCDSVVTMHLHVWMNKTATADSTLCDNRLPLTWNGVDFATEGSQTTTLTAQHGEDSVLTMTVHVNPTYTVDDYDTIVENALPYLWEGLSFSGSGDQTTTLASREACDSVATMHLHVWMNKAATADSTLCDDRLPLTWNGVTFTASGTQAVTLTAQHGEDSVLTMTVHANPTYIVDDYDTIVENVLPYLWEGLTFGGSGSQTTTLASQEACDSVVTMHLYVWMNKTATADSTLCDNQLPMAWNGVDFAAEDSQTVTLTAQHGEDSVLTMNVHVNPTYVVDDYDTIVENALPYRWEGQTFGGSGEQTTTLMSRAGCDSVVTMHLHVWPNLTASDDSTVCDNQLPIVWNGRTFTRADVQSATLTAMHGEDSVVTMTLTLNPTYTTAEYDTICDNQSFNFHGSVYTQAGDYTHTLASREGCDSVVTLWLTVHPTYRVQTPADVCANAAYEWGTPRRTVWEPVQADQGGASQTRTVTQTDNLLSKDRCDSISTLNLTVHGVYLHSERDTFCFGERYQWHGWEGSLNSEHNNTEKTTTLIDTLTTERFGCDSIFKLNLTQRAHPEVSISVGTSCEYTMQINVDVPYHRVLSVPEDSSLYGHEGETRFVLNPAVSTLYTVYADYRETPTCPYTVSRRLNPIVPPQALLKISPEVLASNRLEYDLYDAGEMRDHRRWYIDGVEQADSAWHIKRTADYEADSILIKLVVTRFDCGDSITQVLHIRHDAIYAPNAFAPDQEPEENRCFKVWGKDITSFELSVYNRGGMLVYRTESLDDCWDGAGAPQGVYVWVMRYSIKGIEETPKITSGTVMLIR